jgi:hypothetical protein
MSTYFYAGIITSFIHQYLKYPLSKIDIITTMCIFYIQYKITIALSLSLSLSIYIYIYIYIVIKESEYHNRYNSYL